MSQKAVQSLLVLGLVVNTRQRPKRESKSAPVGRRMSHPMVGGQTAPASSSPSPITAISSELSMTGGLALPKRSTISLDLSNQLTDTESRTCLRASQISQIGRDRLGNRISVDVGKCLSPHARWRHEDAGLADDPAMLSSKASDPCVSQAEIVQHVYPVTGHKRVRVVKACGRSPRECTRMAKNVTFYPGTPFEKSLDVGICQGQCGTHSTEEDSSCKSLQTRKQYFDGPDGPEGVEVVEKCACVGSCYRVVRFDVIPSDDDNFRVLDMGECVGSCSNRKVFTCLFGGVKDASGRCAGPSLYRDVTSSCRPSSFNPLTHAGRSGYTEALQITGCACQHDD